MGDIPDRNAMPETDTPPMVRLTLNVPKALYDDFADLAKSESIKPQELSRILWILGFNSYAEGYNKRAVARNLRKKSGKGGEDPNGQPV